MSHDVVICAECARELMPAPPRDRRRAYNHADAQVIGYLIPTLQQFLYTPLEAEHLMVILRGQIRRPDEGGR
jgi:hypothetical protein